MYPIVILSDDVSGILEKRPHEPQKPADPKKESLKYVYFIILFVGLVFSYLICGLTVSSFKDGEIRYGLIVAGFMLILLFFTFCSLVMIYDATIGNKVRRKKWEKKIEQWEVSHKKWERSIANIKNETFCQIRKQEIVTLLENRDPETIYNNENKSVAKKGITEEWFLFYIKKQIELMGGTLSLNYKIQRSYIKKHLTKEMMLGDLLNPVFYYPDIAIAINNLYIDIEIDEPYSMDSRLPIHCIGSDDYRNTYVTSQGWEVIRFAESQIVEYPEKCLSTIIDVIKHIKQGMFGKPFIDYNEKWITPQWNEESAMDMAKRNYRESYLYDKDGLDIKK